MNEFGFLSTADVAILCRVSTSMVKIWTQRGLLKHTIVPNSRHRKFTKRDVLIFMQQYGIAPYELQEPEPGDDYVI